MQKSVLFLLLLCVCLNHSCTVQKRLHNSGWHVEWRNKHKLFTNDEGKGLQEIEFEKHIDLLVVDTITEKQTVIKFNKNKQINKQNIIQEFKYQIESRGRKKSQLNGVVNSRSVLNKVKLFSKTIKIQSENSKLFSILFIIVTLILLTLILITVFIGGFNEISVAIVIAFLIVVFSVLFLFLFPKFVAIVSKNMKSNELQTNESNIRIKKEKTTEQIKNERILLCIFLGISGLIIGWIVFQDLIF